MNETGVFPRTLSAYFVILYIMVLGVVGSFSNHLATLNTGAVAFALLAIVTYSLLYLMPALILTKVFHLLLLARRKPAKWKNLTVNITACVTGASTLLLLLADRYLFSLYGYHFNGFVWNLLTTQGGIDSLGATQETMIWGFLAILLIFTFNAGIIYLLSVRLDWGHFISPARKSLVSIFVLLVVIFACEEGVYAYVHFVSNEPYLKAVSIIPFHLDTTANKFFKANGFTQPSRQEQIRLAKGQVHYPEHPLQITPPEKYPNIVWLTAESFRWDLFDPEITPNLWAFSKKATTFNQHYSGGNRTRMGMFSMFYGLYAPYWYGFKEQKIRPQLMELIDGADYQMAIHTSQSFSYPELEDTLFTQIPKANMHELKEGPSWQRDHQNISDITSYIQRRDPGRPFFTFMFFESTHAPYNFPDSAVIRENYAHEVNYLQLNNFSGNIEPLHNRYINAAHHVDAEVGRVLALLQRENLLENTIVLFTGDHGEEFMENGHWGHGHEAVFPEQQIRVPLVLWIPGQEPRVVDYPTSHNQIPATILPYLGVTSPAREYSSADNLFSSPRPYQVIGSYDYLAIIDSEAKISFPYTKADYFHYVISDSNDHVLPLKEQKQVLLDKKREKDEVIAECLRFTAQTKTASMHE